MSNGIHLNNQVRQAGSGALCSSRMPKGALALPITLPFSGRQCKQVLGGGHIRTPQSPGAGGAGAVPHWQETCARGVGNTRGARRGVGEVPTILFSRISLVASPDCGYNPPSLNSLQTLPKAVHLIHLEMGGKTVCGSGESVTMQIPNGQGQGGPIASGPAQFGKYTLIQKLGDGGMAEVFLGHMQGLQGFTKMVAIKRMLPHLSADRAFTQSFINEARLGGCLNHHNIVQTIEFGQIDDYYFLAMEYVRGVTLEHVLHAQRERHEAIPVRLAVEIVSQVAEGLAYAHGAEDSEGRPLRMVHRDLKPANILINNHGVCKISDFGVAKSEASTNQTVFGGEVKGTVSYMSPEQAMGERTLDGRSDLFSLGTIFFELLTGQALYPQESYLATLRRAQDADVSDRLPLLAPLPQGERITAVVGRLLQPRAADRYPDAQELMRELRELLAMLEPDWELSDYLKTLLPKSPLNQKLTTVGMNVGGATGMGIPTGPTTGGGSPFQSQQNSSPGMAASAFTGMGTNPGGMVSLGGGGVGQEGVSQGQRPMAPGPSTHPGLTVFEPSQPGRSSVSEPSHGWQQGVAPGENSQTLYQGKTPQPKPIWQKSLVLGLAAAFLVVLVGMAVMLSLGGVKVDSDPSGATLFANGAPLGTLPLSLEVPKTGLAVEARLSGHRSLRTTLKPDQSSVLLRLERAATLSLAIVPPEAAVEVDGKALSGATPYTVEELAGGMHVVKVRSEGYEPMERTLELKAGESTRVELELRKVAAAPVKNDAPPAKNPDRGAGDSPARPSRPVAGPVKTPPPEVVGEVGFLSLNAVPFAAVEIDGRAIKNTPLLRHPLPPGGHSVRLRTEDGREKTLKVNIASGETYKQIVHFD